MATMRKGESSKVDDIAKVMPVEDPTLKVAIDNASVPLESKTSLSTVLLGRHDSVFPDCKAAPSRCPSTIRSPGYHNFDRDETNEVIIGVERRHDEESLDNDTNFSRRVEGSAKRRVAETQKCTESFQEQSSAPPSDPSTKPTQDKTLACARRLKAVTKRTIQGKTVITRSTARKEAETIVRGATGEMDCRRNVDEQGTADEQTETNEEEVTEHYHDG
ncbi:uncharacterized protein LOC135369223 [Ornithodoros turicata]|uniref:uncharacterized protein LOC135369223 n=1 Tax=Ornithodoros turicata TaxID=34597 RepID=UPI0031397F87